MPSLYSRLIKYAAEAQPEAAPTHGVPTLIKTFIPRPHQDKAVQRLLENDGKMIMVHGMGSGKSATSVYGFEKLRQLGRANKALVVTPAGLRENYMEGAVQRFTTSTGHVARRPGEIDPKATYNIVSYETLRQDPMGIMARSGADTLIVDEYHRVRNDQASTNAALFAARSKATNFIGLTASLINNSPTEVASLLALSENNPNLTRQGFRRKFVSTIGTTASFGGKTTKPLLGVRNPEEFAKAVYPKVDYLDTEDLVGSEMPRKQITDVNVPMSDEQYKAYQLALNKLGPIAKHIASRDDNYLVGKADSVFSQLGEARQVSNAMHRGRRDVSLADSALRTPKLRRLVDDTEKHLAEKPDNSVVLYSNLINGGVDALSAGLKARKIPHALFVGKDTQIGDVKVSETVRQQGVRDFKDGKTRAIIISGAGAEGLDLKNATAFYGLDGHFNPERILQAEARARRMGGLAHRPPAERVIDVRRYRSVAPLSETPGVFGRMLGRTAPRTTDEWIYDVAAKKYTTNKQFYEVLRRPAKYLRKETTTGSDGRTRVRYIYPREVPQPSLYARITNQPQANIAMP